MQKQLKRACEIVRKHGGENVTVLATMIGGPATNTIGVLSSAEDWARYGQVQQAVMDDPDIQALMADPDPIASWETYVSQDDPGYLATKLGENAAQLHHPRMVSRFNEFACSGWLSAGRVRLGWHRHGRRRGTGNGQMNRYATPRPPSTPPPASTETTRPCARSVTRNNSDSNPTHSAPQPKATHLPTDTAARSG